MSYADEAKAEATMMIKKHMATIERALAKMQDPIYVLEQSLNDVEEHSKAPSTIQNPHFRYTYHNNHGERYVPVNAMARSFASLAGSRTLSFYEMRIIRGMGFEIRMDPPGDKDSIKHYRNRRFKNEKNNKHG